MLLKVVGVVLVLLLKIRIATISLLQKIIAVSRKDLTIIIFSWLLLFVSIFLLYNFPIAYFNNSEIDQHYLFVVNEIVTKFVYSTPLSLVVLGLFISNVKRFSNYCSQFDRTAYFIKLRCFRWYNPFLKILITCFNPT
jgi:hypothetical protein